MDKKQTLIDSEPDPIWQPTKAARFNQFSTWKSLCGDQLRHRVRTPHELRCGKQMAMPWLRSHSCYERWLNLKANAVLNRSTHAPQINGSITTGRKTATSIDRNPIHVGRDTNKETNEEANEKCGSVQFTFLSNRNICKEMRSTDGHVRRPTRRPSPKHPMSTVVRSRVLC